jgi:hypothetical protein
MILKDLVEWCHEFTGVIHKGTVRVDIGIASFLDDNVTILRDHAWWEVGIFRLEAVVRPHGLGRPKAFLWCVLANGTGWAVHSGLVGAFEGVFHIGTELSGAIVGVDVEGRTTRGVLGHPGGGIHAGEGKFPETSKMGKGLEAMRRTE